MPKLTKSPPKYRLHKASGQAIVTIAGRHYYLGQWRSKASKIEYDRLIGEWLAAGRPTHASLPDEITILELANAYQKFAKSYYRKNGQPSASMPGIKVALGWLCKYHGRTRAVDFGPLAFKSLIQKMVERGYCRRYVNDHIGRLRRIFKWGVGEELIPPTVYQALIAVPGLRKGRTEAPEAPPVLPVDDATVEATLPHLPAVIADMVRIQRLTGARPSEVCVMRPCDVDTSGEPWIYRPMTHKTEHRGRERVIAIGPRGQDVLRPYLLRQKEGYCFVPAESEQKRRRALHDRRVTPLSYGNRPGTNRKRRPKRMPGELYTTHSYRRAIHRVCNAVGISLWSPNRLRHTAATQIRKLFGVGAAQVTLGHAKADVTQIYAERDMALAARVMQEVG